MDAFPKIKKMTVVPVAGYDSFLLNLSGGHGPLFIRNIVVLEDNSGNTGLGECPGGAKINKLLQDTQEIVQGSRLGAMNDMLNKIRLEYSELDKGGRGLQTFDQRIMIHALTALESACLDLTGKTLGVPVAELLGDGQQRQSVDVLGYLFFIGEYKKTKLNYKITENPADDWQQLRHEETLDAVGIVKQADAARQRFGFNTFKLKGGVLSAEKECECILALAESFPAAGLTIDPNGCWSLQKAVDVLKPLKNILTYAEDPCGAERGLSGRQVLAEFRKQTGIATATNMVAVDYPQLVQAIKLEALDIPLADCHFWTMRGAVNVSMMCELWGLTWGSHSNNHFDISLAMMTHTAAAAKGQVTPIDTHWIWQEGQRLTKEPLQIKKGMIKVPQTPGLGIEIDEKQLEQAHQLYKQNKTIKRDDAIAMQFLKPGWTFDPKRPALDR